jgi:outer membrane usher protein FimD/PapC
MPELKMSRPPAAGAEASYSRTFDTGTNLVLAAYRYSTSGFRDLQDVLGVRRQLQNGMNTGQIR